MIGKSTAELDAQLGLVCPVWLARQCYPEFKYRLVIGITYDAVPYWKEGNKPPYNCSWYGKQYWQYIQHDPAVVRTVIAPWQESRPFECPHRIFCIDTSSGREYSTHDAMLVGRHQIRISGPEFCIGYHGGPDTKRLGSFQKSRCDH